MGSIGSRIGGLQIFQVLRYAALMAIGILFAKSSLDTSSIGLYESLMLLSGFTGFFWTGALMNTLIPLYARADEPGKKALLAGVLRSALLLNTFLTLALLLLPSFWWKLLGLSSQPTAIWWLFCAFVFFNNPAYLVEYTYLVRNKTRELVQYGIGMFLMQILAVGLPPFLGFGLTESIAGLTLVSLLRWLWLFYLLKWETVGASPGLLWKQHLHLATPLAGSLLLGGAAAYLDGFIVSHFLGQESLAIFRYGARELPLVLLLANAFSTVASGHVAEDLPESLHLIKRRSAAFLHRFSLVTIGLMFTSAWLFPLVFRAEFVESHTVFNIYLLLLIPRLLFPQTILTGLQKTNVIFWTSAVEISLNAGLSLALVGPYGMAGVAWATVIAHFADKFILVAYVHRKLGIAPSNYIQWPLYLRYSIILAACYALAP